VIPPDIQELITGMMLGDACIIISHGYGKANANLQIKQKDKEFVDHLYEKLQDCGVAAGEPKTSTCTHPKTGNTHSAFYFDSRCLPFFTGLHNLWYNRVEGKNIKVVPSNISSILTPRAFAYWLSGDGHFDKSQGSIVLCTDSFTSAEVDRLRTALLSNLNIGSTRCATNKAKQQYRIRIPKREVPKVQSLVKLHIPSSMAYRVGL
jgi:hypothetical protein